MPNGRGYAGLQTNASTTRRLFLFSVWDVTEARPGSQGSWCEAFGGEGEGMSCRIWHTWTPGQTYRFHYRSEGGGWWGMTVTNTSTKWSCNGGANQQWSHSNGRIVNAASGKCLDAANGSSADGTRLIIWTCGSNANQQWSIPARP